MPALLVKSDLRGAASGSRPRQKTRRGKLPPLRVAFHMRARDGRGPHSTGWLASLLFHVALVVVVASLLVRAAHDDVVAGKTSTELALVAAPPTPVDVRLPAPAKPVPPPPVPLAQPVLPPTPARKISPVVPTSPALVARPHPAAAVAGTEVHPAKESSVAAPGAIEARPDDLDNQPPIYPEDSRAAREQGVVMLRVDVSAAGEAGHVAVLKSSGYFRLDRAARDAVRGWRFRPALLGGSAVSSEVDVPVRFELQ